MRSYRGKLTRPTTLGEPTGDSTLTAFLLAVGLTAVVSALSVVGCDQGPSKHSVKYTNVTSDLPNLRYEEPGHFVFRSEKELRDEIKRRSLQRNPPVPRIDFSRQMLIVVAAGVRSSAGYRLKLLSLTGDRKKLAVKVKELTPPPNSLRATVLTYPYLALTVPTSNAEARVEFEGR